MKTPLKTLLLASCLGLASLLSSCQTAPVQASHAVTCDKCKTVWVQRPTQIGSSGKGGFYAMTSSQSMSCPDCESAAATFFKTGSLTHRCSHCGGALTHCESH